MVQYLVSSAVRAFEFEVRGTEAIDKAAAAMVCFVGNRLPRKSPVEQPFQQKSVGST